MSDRIEKIFLCLLIGVILGGVIYFCLNFQSKPQERLKDILQKESNEVFYIKNWNCYDYAKYYNKTLTEKYPELDIRWVRYVDICANKTYCDSKYHTFLVVGGYGGECILDQNEVSCINLV